MENEDYRMIMIRKLFLLLPLFLASFCLFSCAVKNVPELTHNEAFEKSGSSDAKVDAHVEEMPAALGGPTVIGYPSRPQGFSADKYVPGEKYVVGYPIKSKDASVEGNKSGKKYVVGYPARPKILLAPTAEETILLIKN